MRKRTTEYFLELEKCDMSQELKCVNALQDTPWQINKHVLAVLRQAWDSGQTWGAYQQGIIYRCLSTLLAVNLAS